MSEVVSRLDRITVDPLICHGAPTIRGMRLRVQDILAVLEFAALDSTGRRQRVVA